MEVADYSPLLFNQPLEDELVTVAGRALKQNVPITYKIPNGTFALVAANVLVHVRPQSFKRLVPSKELTCLSPKLERDLRRLLVSGFVHKDAAHLLYNMVSFSLKGSQLEKQVGPKQLLETVGDLLTLSHGLVVAVSWLLAKRFNMWGPYNSSCVGFSGVLFALQAVHANRAGGMADVLGYQMPASSALLVELIVNQLVLPQGSFLGHMCGVMAGLAYVHVSPFILAAWRYIFGKRFNPPSLLLTVSAGFLLSLGIAPFCRAVQRVKGALFRPKARKLGSGHARPAINGTDVGNGDGSNGVDNGEVDVEELRRKRLAKLEDP
eukprot:jgi/Chlat1/3184/Chrsp22S03458